MKAGGAPAQRAKALALTVRRLERRLAVATTTLEALRKQQARTVAAVRRAADRKLARMVQELAALRHHEARAAALERLLAERAAGPAPEPRGDGEDPRTAG